MCYGNHIHRYLYYLSVTNAAAAATANSPTAASFGVAVSVAHAFPVVALSRCTTAPDPLSPILIHLPLSLLPLP